MKKIILIVLTVIMAFSFACAFTACNEEEELSRWDVRQFYGTYENIDRGVNFSLGTIGNEVHQQLNTNHLEVGKVVTTEGEYEYNFITQEIADWANGYLNNFTTKIVIDEDKIRIGELEYSYGATFSYDIDENGELYDEHYLFLATSDKDELSFAVGYGPEDRPAINFKFKTKKEIDGVSYTIAIYHFLYKTN